MASDGGARAGDRAGLLLASNRGPVSFHHATDGSLVGRRGAGGLVSGLTAAMSGQDGLWLSAALSEADRSAAAASPNGRIDRSRLCTPEIASIAVRVLDVPPRILDHAYNTVANSVLWYVNHGIYDSPRRPVFDASFRRAWADYRAYNRLFAEAIADAAEPGAKVLVEDYHLTLVPRLLRDLRPDLRIGHFTHTPWARPESFRMLPDDVGAELLTGMLAADCVGFLSQRWSDAFAACCADRLGAVLDADRVTVGGPSGERVSERRVWPLGVDGPALRERARRPDVVDAVRALRRDVGPFRILLRVDRSEPTKNVLRGLASWRELLRRRPDLHGQVVHVVIAYPSRGDLVEYRRYAADARALATSVVDEFATDDWSPVRFYDDDDFARTLAAYRLADTLVVNPIRDGMNLVAKEGPVVSEDACALVLSTEAGAADELGAAALTVNPFDVTATAAAIERALDMAQPERRERHRHLVEAATALPPSAWFAAQVAALGD